MGLFSPDIDTSLQDFQMEEALRARVEEQRRQAQISNGMATIRAIFDGGVHRQKTFGPVEFDAQDYLARYPGMARDSKLAKKDPLKQFVKYGAASGKEGFTYDVNQGPIQWAEGMSPLLRQREKAQQDYYLPQLDNQKADAQKELTFALARAGLLNSTTAGERQGDLSQDFSLQRGSVLSKIASDIAGKKTWLNQQRATIESGLRASGDQTGATDQALSAMTSFAQEQPTLNPLGHLFAGVSEGIGAAQRGAQAERVRNSSYAADPLTTKSGRLVGA